MKRLALITLTMLSLTLAACSEEEETKIVPEDLPAQKDMEFSEGDQTFHIRPFYEELFDYIEVVEKNSNLNTIGTWNYTVMDPLRKELKKRKLLLKHEIPPIVTTTSDVQTLKEHTGGLIERQGETNEIIKEALLKSSRLLRGGDKFVYVLPVNPDARMKSMAGVAAWTLDDNVILLLLDPSYSKERLAYTMAHEYNHAVTMEHVGGYSNLLDFVLFEGKGDSFAKKVYPGVEVPWTKGVSQEELEMPLSQLREYGTSWNLEMYNEWFNGNPSLNIPRRANYQMGYLMMQSYLKDHKGMSVEEWTSLDADDIILESEYRGFME